MPTDEDVLTWAETAVGLLFDANYSEREALFIQNTIERLAAEVRELRKDRERLEWLIQDPCGFISYDGEPLFTKQDIDSEMEAER